MSWIAQLSRAYDICADAGMISAPGPDGLRPLTPLYHDLQMADIEAVIDEETLSLVEAHLIDRKSEMETRLTILPVTDQSVQRTSNPNACPHALHDKVGIITHNEYDNAYMRNLAEWVGYITSQEPQNAAGKGIQAVYQYLNKYSLAEDFIEAGIPENGLEKLLVRWSIKRETDWFSDDEDEPDILKLYESRDAWDLYVAYMGATLQAGDDGLCYATGETGRLARSAPKKIVPGGENAKLLCSLSVSQDERPAPPATGKFTYLGDRFLTPGQAMQVNADAVSKSTAMLRWLIDHQGWSIMGSRPTKREDGTTTYTGTHRTPIIVMWSTTSPAEAIQPAYVFEGGTVNGADILRNPAIASIYHASRGRRWEDYLDTSEDVLCVMTIDMPSIGRLSVTGYQELPVQEYCRILADWHHSMAWGDENPPTIRTLLIALWDYNYERGGQLIGPASTMVYQLLGCINREMPLPHNIVTDLYNRAIHTELWPNIAAMRRRSEEEVRSLHRQHLRLTRQMMRKEYMDTHPGEEIPSMYYGLDEGCEDKNYLYGRALACLDAIEIAAVRAKGGKASRPSNAWQMMPSYMLAPATTLRRLIMAVNPYVSGNWAQGCRQMAVLNTLIARISVADSIAAVNIDTPLAPTALLGYLSQLESD